MAELALAYRDFSFSYVEAGASAGAAADVGGKMPVIGPVNWEIADGDFVLLTGATGSGKTTLLRCAKPELAPTGECMGDILAFGESTPGLSVERSAQLIGYVAQSPDNQIVCSTVWHQMAFGLENLGMPQADMRRRVAEVAHFFNMEPWFEADVNGLSGGQKQLLNLASILVMRPRVLLLDEPTAQLDPVAEKNFLHALFRLNRELGLTVVVATHAPEAAVEYATAAARVEDGTVRPVELEGLRPQDAIVQANDSSAQSEMPVVELSQVHFRYERQAPWVLRGVDLAIGEGELHVLLGGNASGKSTLLGVMAGTLKPERGKVRNALSGCQAFLPQNPKALFVCDTVGEELREWQKSCGYADAEVNAALAEIGLATCEARHPYDLSGGQQQLLALVKLLLTRPRLLLLDEPTKGLDAPSKLKVAQLLQAFCVQGGSAVMATHDLTFAAAVANEVSLVFDGELAATEPASDFFRDNLFYRPVADAFWAAWSESCRTTLPADSELNALQANASEPVGSGANRPLTADGAK